VKCHPIGISAACFTKELSPSTDEVRLHANDKSVCVPGGLMGGSVPGSSQGRRVHDVEDENGIAKSWLAEGDERFRRRCLMGARLHYGRGYYIQSSPEQVTHLVARDCSIAR